MSADQTFPDATALALHLQRLRLARSQRVASRKAACPGRAPLTKLQRARILLKSGGRCHICGGPIDAQDWEADHVLAHSAGGGHSLENYLPAHSLCNNYRWHYDTEEFQWILKLGVWLRTHIENQTPVGLVAGPHFVGHERRRSSRRRTPSGSVSRG